MALSDTKCSPIRSLGHNTRLEAALALAGYGFLVIPLKPGNKEPQIRAWQKQATRDPKQITKWWKQWPTANLGVKTGHLSELVVVDVDVKNDQPGWQSLEQLSHDFALPPTLEIQTGSGGRHMYFRHSEQKKIGDRIGFRPGIDIKADSGYVVAPPSVVDGNPYVWLNDLPLADIPEALVDAMLAPKNLSLATQQGKIVEGHRNTELTSQAGKWRAQGMSPSQLRDRLLVHNTMHCDPPLPDADVRKIARSIGRKPAGDSAREPRLYTWRRLIRSPDGPPSSTTRAVLMNLSLHMKPNGDSCFPTIKQQAEETALSERAVRKHLRCAVEQGFLETYDRQGTNQPWLNHGYIPTIPPHLHGSYSLNY